MPQANRPRSYGGSTAPSLPTCCGDHRLAALDVVEAALTNDVTSSYDRMRADGWTADAAIDSLRGCYRAWVLGRFGDAIDLGLELVENNR